MRKLVAISLLGIYLFNLMGYTLPFYFLIQNADASFIQELNTYGNEEQNLLEIKMPMHLPYGSDWKDYERTDGQVELNGIYYNYVKKKVCKDTLYLMIAPNYAKTKLCEEKIRLVQEVNGPASDQKGNKPAVKKNLVPTEWNFQRTEFQFGLCSLIFEIPINQFASHLSNVFKAIPVQPPETSS